MVERLLESRGEGYIILERFDIMKVRDLVDKKLSLEIDGVAEADLDLEVEGLTIHTEDKNKDVKARVTDKIIHNDERQKDDLEKLGYSFEVGV